MTPEQTLTAAAAKLRAAATAASTETPAPWTARPRRRELPAGSHQLRDATGDRILHGPTRQTLGPYVTAPVGRYLTMVHPGVGAALADWLDTAAATWAYLTNANQDAALAVARQILGDQP